MRHRRLFALVLLGFGVSVCTAAQAQRRRPQQESAPEATVLVKVLGRRGGNAAHAIVQVGPSGGAGRGIADRSGTATVRVRMELPVMETFVYAGSAGKGDGRVPVVLRAGQQARVMVRLSGG